MGSRHKFFIANSITQMKTQLSEIDDQELRSAITMTIYFKLDEGIDTMNKLLWHKFNYPINFDTRQQHSIITASLKHWKRIFGYLLVDEYVPKDIRRMMRHIYDNFKEKHGIIFSCIEI